MVGNRSFFPPNAIVAFGPLSLFPSLFPPSVAIFLECSSPPPPSPLVTRMPHKFWGPGEEGGREGKSRAHYCHIWGRGKEEEEALSAPGGVGGGAIAAVK